MNAAEARNLLADVVKKARDRHSDAVAKVDYSVVPDLDKRPWKAWVKTYGADGAVLCFVQSAARRIHRPADAIVERLEHLIGHHGDSVVAMVSAAHMVLHSTLGVAHCNQLLVAAEQRGDLLALMMEMAPVPEWSGAGRVVEWASRQDVERARAWLGPHAAGFPGGTRDRVQTLLATPVTHLSVPTPATAPRGAPVWTIATADLQALATDAGSVPVSTLRAAFGAAGLEAVRDDEHGIVLSHERRFGPSVRFVVAHGPLDGGTASIRAVQFFSGQSLVPLHKVEPHAFSDMAQLLMGLAKPIGPAAK